MDELDEKRGETLKNENYGLNETDVKGKHELAQCLSEDVG